MRKMTVSALAAIAVVAAIGIVGRAQAPGQDRGRGQSRAGSQGQPPIASPAGQAVARGGPADPLYNLEDAFLQWPLLPADKAYGAIDGHHLQQLVEDQTAISRRYRDHGHPQFWGRVMGSSADEEHQRWMLDRFKQMGLTDVHVQSFDLAPQWMPQSWEITARSRKNDEDGSRAAGVPDVPDSAWRSRS
jgi:hypothetical protein